MARSVFLGIATASFALALTFVAAKPSIAMSFSDYDGSAEALGNRANVSQLFAGRLTAAENRRAAQAQALQDVREGRSILPAFTDAQTQSGAQRPISLTLPF